MRVFARYMPQAEHDDLVDALILEQRLQHRIQARCKSRRPLWTPHPDPNSRPSADFRKSMYVLVFIPMWALSYRRLE